MDLGQPARSLVPTVDAPVLLALHATTRPLTGRRLATLAGASHTAVNAILGRLTRAGVVLAERQGSAVLYRASREHVGWAVVEALAGMRRSALDGMRAEIASWQTGPVTAVRFGSFARGEGDEDGATHTCRRTRAVAQGARRRRLLPPGRVRSPRATPPSARVGLMAGDLTHRPRLTPV